MSADQGLSQLLDEPLRGWPDKVAIEEPGHGEITFRELARLSDRVRDRLIQLGVRPGDRVGVYLRKSIDAVASILGILKAGAAYVPVDPYSPARRAAYILKDCVARVVILENHLADACFAELAQLGAHPYLLRLHAVGAGVALRAALDDADQHAPAAAVPPVVVAPDELAYILYTSGSTGTPKGVMLSQRNALAFIDWCSQTFSPRVSDRFSSHAPFHFDLSIFDLYVSLKHGATLVLISSEVGQEPTQLATLLAARRITTWYSTPSILCFLAQYGKMERHDYSALRQILFAGEVFPLKHFLTLKTLLPHLHFYNLYGPTETNVCTYFQVPEYISPECREPFPIGKACSHCRVQVLDEQGRRVVPGAGGELVVAGSSVMQGYWNSPERTAQAFLVDRSGQCWYKTGDIVVEDSNGNYHYVGRRDRMVKRRGYRIELGEIEAELYRHPAVSETAVIARPDETSGVRLIAFLSCPTGNRPSVIQLKKFCAENLPRYMVPDVFLICDALPKTSTAKTDYRALEEYAIAMSR